MTDKSALRKAGEQTGIVVSGYMVAQPFGTWLSAWLSARGIPMPEVVATGAILTACSVAGRVALHLWQHWTTKGRA